MLEELKKLVADGKSINELAKHFNSTPAKIKTILKTHNLKTSGRGGGRELNPIVNGKKVCRMCNVEKPIEEFYKRKDRDGYNPTCKPCLIKHSMQAEDLLKETCVNYMGGKCSRCHGKFELAQYAFHHLDPKEKDFNISEYRSASFLTIKPELDKCILVCHNCHHEIHHEIVEKSGYTNKIKDNSERWNLSKQLHLEATGKDCCENCGYNTYKGSLCIILPEGVKRKNTIHFDKEYSDALKDSVVICQNCLKLDWN